MRTVILALITVLIVAGGLAGYLLYANHGSQGKPWYFRGAYANYTVSGLALFFPIQGEARMIILDYNSTHVKVKTILKLTSPITDTNITVDWEPINDTSGHTEDNCTLVNRSIVSYAGEKVLQENYKCIDKDGDVYNETDLIEPTTHMPIKLVRKDDMYMTMVLSDTNIPELEPFLVKG